MIFVYFSYTIILNSNWINQLFRLCNLTTPHTDSLGLKDITSNFKEWFNSIIYKQYKQVYYWISAMVDARKKLLFLVKSKKKHIAINFDQSRIRMI